MLEGTVGKERCTVQHMRHFEREIIWPNLSAVQWTISPLPNGLLTY